MNKLSKEKTQQIILVGILGVGVAIALWIFGVSAMSSKRAQTQTKINAMDAQIAAGEKLLATAAAKKAELETIRKELDKIESSQMAKGELFIWIDSKLNDIIFNNGFDVSIPTKTPGDIVDVGLLPEFPYRGVKYAVRGSGYFHEFGKFVAEFENSMPYTRIQNVEMMPAETMDAKSEKLSFRFEIVALQKPQDQAAQ